MTPRFRRASIPIALCFAMLAGPAAVLAGPMGYHRDGTQRIDDRLERMTEELKLTPEQQAQVRTLIEEQQAAIDRLRQDTRSRIDAMLTDTQRAERDRTMDRRIERRVDRMADRLDLTTDQTAQIRAIFEERRDDPDLTRTEVRERIVAVLTDAQRKAFENVADRRGGRRGGPDGGPGPGL
jgi:protein CpxP